MLAVRCFWNLCLRPVSVLPRSFHHELQPHMAQQRGLEPPILCRIPAFQAGRLPLSHCCIGSGSWVRTNNPLGQNQVLFQLSYAAIWAQAEQGSPARANRGKEENNMARFRGWRQRRASNPQARRPPVFRTGWHSHLPSLPYWKSWTPCALLYLYYMHFLRFIFREQARVFLTKKA